MELSESTLILLRDDAYASLCREALSQDLAALAAEKAEVETTRPPFGLLARKETRAKFETSMRTVHDTDAALRDRLSRLDAVEATLHPMLRRDIGEYLRQNSTDYSLLLQLSARLDDWERTFQALPELLLGFARDLRSLRLAATSAGQTGALRSELAALRLMAARLEAHDCELAIIQQAVGAAAAAAAANEIVAPALPDFRRTAWACKLATVSPAHIVDGAAPVEGEVRRFLAGGAEEALVRLETGRRACTGRIEHFRQSYCDQLRVHARQYYVEEREVDAVLEQLFHAYVEVPLAQQQSSIVFDPLVER